MMNQPLDVSITRSSGLTRLTMALHGLGLGVAVALAFTRPIFWLILPLVVWSAWRAWQPGLVTRLQIGPGSACRIEKTDGSWERGEVTDAAVYGALATSLKLTIDYPNPRTRHLLIVADTVHTTVFRRLRVRLRVLSTGDLSPGKRALFEKIR